MIFIWISLCLIYATDTSVYASYTSGRTFRFLTEHTCIGSQYKLMERPIHDLKSWPKKEFNTKLRKRGSFSEKFRNWLNSISHQFFFHTHLGDRMELCFGFSGILHSIEVCLKFPTYSKKFLTNLYPFIQGSLEWPFSEFSVMHCYGTYTNLLLLTLSCPEF